MSDIRQHRNPEAIWLFDYPSLLACDDCPEFLVLLSERDINIIWQSVLNIDRIRSRVFTERHADNYTIVDLDQFGLFKEWVSDLNVNLGDYMACQGVLEGILEQLTILANNQCCQQGSGGAGTNPALPSPVVSTPEAREGDPPVGHASWEAYDTYKCDAANYIIDSMLEDIATVSIIAVGGLTIGTLATILVPLLITPIGWVAILGLAALMIEMTALAASYAAITTHLEANRNEYICAILDGTDVGSSINSFTAKVDEILPPDTGFEDPITAYISTNFLNSFATVDSFNRLYSKVAGIPTGGDCSDCEELPPVYFILSDPLEVGDTGTLSRTGDHYSLTSTFTSGRHAVCVLCLLAGDPPTFGCALLDNITVTGDTHSVYPDAYYPCTSEDYEAATGGSMEAYNNVCLGQIIFQSDTAFSVEFDLVESCE